MSHFSIPRMAPLYFYQEIIFKKDLKFWYWTVLKIRCVLRNSNWWVQNHFDRCKLCNFRFLWCQNVLFSIELPLKWWVWDLISENWWVWPRTSQDMDGALHTDFATFYTIWVSATKISGLLQLGEKWILTKFEGCGSKIGPATPIWSFRRFWREIQIQGTKCLQI